MVMDWHKVWVTVAVAVVALVILAFTAGLASMSERQSQMMRRLNCGKGFVSIEADGEWVCIAGVRPGEKP